MGIIPVDMPIPASLVDRTGALLVIAARTGQELATRRLAPMGLNVRLCGVLNRLAEGPVSQQELGEQLGIDRTTMVELIDELERQGAVVRRRNAADRRSYALSLTPRGRTVQKRAAKAFDDAADEFFGALKPAERDDLAVMLRRLIVKADASLAPSKGGRNPSADRQHKKSSA
ncbi:MAG: MarR family transcriptional regulator [Chloroflexi bacterium]|nr:MAG: MarR family transcriptional regulator [Chloroflexota bacterium]